MKKFVLTFVFIVMAVTTYANILTIINNSNCTYTISTDGGVFVIYPFQIVQYDSPYVVGGGTPADDNFHVVKVALGQDVVDVTEYGPFYNTSTYSYSCNNNSPYNVAWSMQGLNVLVTIN